MARYFSSYVEKTLKMTKNAVLGVFIHVPVIQHLISFLIMSMHMFVHLHRSWVHFLTVNE